MIETLRPDVVGAGLGLVGIAMAFTQRQKDYLKQVYNNKCQGKLVGMKHECTEKKGLAIHHIIPQAYAYSVLGWTEEQVDSELQGIPLCENAHVNRLGNNPNAVHTDQFEALREYRAGNKNAFQELQMERKRKLERGEKYWNTQWDLNFTRMAIFTINRFRFQHPKMSFPKHNHKKVA